MSFWKLVAAIVVGNLLTGIVATALWLLFIASLLSGALGAGGNAEQAAAPASTTYQQSDQSSPREDVTNWPSAKGRKLSAPDANGCIKELAEEAGGHC